MTSTVPILAAASAASAKGEYVFPVRRQEKRILPPPDVRRPRRPRRSGGAARLPGGRRAAGMVKGIEEVVEKHCISVSAAYKSQNACLYENVCFQL